ncbi:MAG: hypothetical protein K0U74_00375 [Alphaproteobacteria bacterium]|nr:hypothetical protein [Alphaproteobacteria bacterium]
MKKATIILAAIATAVAAMATAPAQAGGKRLHFGGPIGHFKAFPHKHNSHNNAYKRRQLAKKKAAQRRAAARRAKARKAAARKAAARKAHARKVAAQRAAARKAKARKIAAARKAKAKRIAAARRAKARRIASAKARKLAAAKQVANVVENKSDDADWNAPVRASAIAGTNTLKFYNKNDDAQVEEVIEDKQAENDADRQENVAVAELECKKYIASAGLTVTVPCGS